MPGVLVFLLATLRDSLRTGVGLQAEVLALRHQLLVLQHRNQKRQLQLLAFDRLLWGWKLWTGTPRVYLTTQNAWL